MAFSLNINADLDVISDLNEAIGVLENAIMAKERSIVDY